MDTPLTRNFRPDGEAPEIDAYRRVGGYEAVRRAVTEMSPDQVTALVTQANLRGRGGAGFPAGLKWQAMTREAGSGRRYLIANADEMEPGAFKDRLLMERDPHQLIEGIICSAYALQAEVAYIFLRASYEPAASRLQRAIDEAYAAGLLGQPLWGSGFRLDLHLHVSAGRYICGESSALLNALEGRRAIPRAKPPRPTTSGLFGRPTVVNNVETLCNVGHIVNRGAQWFLDISRARSDGKFGKDGGTKIFGVSGRVRRPGFWELPMGTTLRELIEGHAGGMAEGYRLAALLPGGASTGLLTPEHLDLPMDFDSPEKHGSRFGTGTVVVLDDRTCPVGMVHNLEKFFARESCGWCTPCRDGLPWVERILAGLEEGRGAPGDIELLEMHCGLLGMGMTFCAHAPGAMEPLKSALRHFRPLFERHIAEGGCPYKKGTGAVMNL